MLATTLLLLVAATVASAASSEGVWWESAVMYQIYTRSFKDSNGDGIGDLNGIREKLSYFKQTGVDVIWLSPIYLSPMYDFGYDITDHRAIAPEYGTMEDFDALVIEAKRLGLYVILDFVPNHTSNASEWFVKSRQRVPGYEDFYVWGDGLPDPEDPKKLLPPSNWLSLFRKTAWHFDEERKQFYMHVFVPGQPDLNLRNPRVKEEMKDLLLYWLDKGVSGFRVDAVNMMYEADPKNFGGRYPDEPPSGAAGTVPDDYEYLNHTYTRDRKENFGLVYEWRAVLDEYERKVGERKLMMTEGYTDMLDVMNYYGDGVREGSVPFNFQFQDLLSKESNAWDIKTIVDKWMMYMPYGKIPNWVNGNHDIPRMANRQGLDRVDAMNMLSLILPGIAVLFQGDELGMTDGAISWEDTKDPRACSTGDPINYWKRSRDPARTPFPWDDSPHAGFSNTTGSTWLPVADNYKTVNLAAEIKAERSHYKFYQDVAAIKKWPAVRNGDLDTRALSKTILVVTRLLPNYPGVVAIVNLADYDQVVDLSSIKLLPKMLRVVASGVSCSLEKWQQKPKNKLPISAHCAVVFQTITRCC